MDGLKILSLGYWDRHDKERRTDECTKAEWNELLKDFNSRARGEAANMAAHNWDVLLLDGQLIVAGRNYPGSERKDNSGWILTKDQEGWIYSTKASQELLKKLYNGEERLF